MFSDMQGVERRWQRAWLYGPGKVAAGDECLNG